MDKRSSWIADYRGQADQTDGIGDGMRYRVIDQF
jgi:hypothetical protein